ncbi:immunoglobulin-like domain-containing protein [Alkalibacterium putridalgicola]|uniref:immunoglobulin-like domain-containing protein n=1 Tax=Alkalibacterium putridalgicola TaxID=426703 RepID=UPI0034CD784C
MNRKSFHNILLFFSLFLIGLLLSGCQTARINTAVTLPDDIHVEQNHEIESQIVSSFERETYSNEEMDEMFYLVENLSEQPIEVSEFYFVQKWVEDEWKSLDNNAIERIERTVQVFPGETAEFVFWLSMESGNIDEGTYRLSTRVTFLEEEEEHQEGQAFNIIIPFEITE